MALTAGCLALHLSNCRLAQTLENHFQDGLTILTCRPAQSRQVAIVEIDETSLAALGQWPWPRHLVAALTTRIFEQGASVVAFDVLFAEPDRTSPAVVEQDMKQHLGVEARVTGVPPELRNYDALFAAAISNRNVILGCEMIPEGDAIGSPDAAARPDPAFRGTVVCVGKGTGKRYLLHARDAIMPLPELAASAHTAFFNAVPDADNIVRRYPLLWAVADQRFYPALALEAVRLHQHPEVAASVARYDDDGGVRVDIGPTSIPVDHAGRCILNYRAVTTNQRTGLSGSFPSYAAVDVLQGTVATNALAGRIVLVGASATGLKDIKATPLTRFFSGVEVHATLIDNVLAGDVLCSPSWMVGADAVAVLLVGLFLTACIARGRAWVSLAVTLAVLTGSAAASYLCITHAALLVLPAWSVICVALVYPVLTTMRFWAEERQKHRVRKMFGTMVSSKVLRYLENHPDNFSLCGVKTEATVFFSDVRGFTTISESLPPEQLTALLNRYLSPMTEIIMQSDGYVDKYEGDAIMAEWGVPFAVDDHAVKACHAALDQQAALAALRPALEAEFGHALHVRMGVNTGVLTAGNMGARDRFQYTVMGDTVNQAARLEPANKDYGTSIMIGEATYQAAREHIEVRLLDKIIVMGKTQAVAVYELLGRKGQVDSVRLDIARLYEKALALHWERDWGRAFETLGRALDLDPRDGPSQALLSRIRNYITNPPPDTWQGEHRRASKD